MKKTFLRRVIALALAGTLAVSSAPSFALDTAQGEVSTDSSQAGKVSGTWTLDMWHYSGGYWKVGNKGSEQIRIEDKDIVSLDSYLQGNQQAAFIVGVPQEIADLVSEGVRGTDWDVAFADYRWRDCSLLFKESGPDSVVLMSGNQIQFTATPVFHFNNSGASLRDYVPGMAVTVPLVDKKWGCNIYSVFGNGRSAVQGLGYYNEDDPSDTGSNAIHPSFITGKSGALEAGHPITLGVNVVDSAGYSIGSGTFAAAGACGLHFEFPVSLVFTDLRTPDPGEEPGTGEEPGDPDDSGSGDPGTDPGGGSPGTGEDPGDPGSGGDPTDPGTGTDPAEPEDPGDPSDPAQPADTADIAGLDAILELPQTSYAGHDVLAKDCSLYEIDGRTVTASRAAELGLGKSSFSIVQKGAGSIRKSGKTGAVAVFTKPGTFQVRLTAEAANGLKDTDTQTIQILKTPYILEDLGGVQKENRKQKLLVTVAQDPSKPVNELTIVLSEAESRERISVSKVFGGAEETPANAEHIKYRSLTDNGSDAYFLCVELDFLTKWHETRTLSYEIRAKDGAGNTDNAFGSFEVAPDLPPVAAIGLEDVYYRRENSNTASVTADCLSSTDGDALQRTWQFKAAGGSWLSIPAMAGYKDLSFGSAKNVCFDKTGVGTFTVRLTVRDRWTEETLPEYVTEADYLSASAERSSVVGNVAPRVSLDLLKTETAEIFVLAGTDALRRDVLAAAPGLKASLLAEGIAADVNADFRQAKSGARTGELTEVTTGGHGAKNYRSGSQQLHSASFRGMWDGGNIVSDGRYSYMLTPTVQTYGADPKYSVNTYPFTLTARDADGKTVWSATVSRAVLDSQTDLRDASWGCDADGTYLYLMDGGKTALFDIRTGTYVATLGCELGPFNLVTAENIYAFKDSGIWRLSRGGGTPVCVYNTPVSCPALAGGAVQFLVRQDLGKGLGLYRGTFDPNGETVRCRLLEGSLEGYAQDAQGLAIDAAGAVFVRTESAVYCFGADDLLTRTIALKDSSRSFEVFPVWSGSGEVHYIGQTGIERHAKYYEVWCRCCSVATGAVFDDSRTGEDNYPNMGEPVVFGLEDANGAVGIYLGAQYVYATGERYMDHVLFSLNGTFSDPLGFPMEHGFQSIRYADATANLNGTSDIKQIVHVAESPEDEEERLKRRNLSYTKDYTVYETLDGSQTESSLASFLSGIVQKVKDLKEQGENAAVVRGGSAALTRGISLAPDTTYYYEYDTTAENDIFSVEAQLARPSGMPASSGGYQVTASHVENFDDDAVDRFFTMDASAIQKGRCRIGYLRTKADDSPAVQKGASYKIRFAVPQGCLAVLSADYEFSCSSGDPLAKQLLLAKDGGAAQALDIPSAGLTRASGTYMHASLLAAGSYELSCLVQDRTKNARRESTFWIDNLKVLIVQEGAAQQSAGYQALATSSSVRGEGTVRHVTGSFTTPEQTLHFGTYACQRLTGLSNGFASFTEKTSGYSKALTLDLAVPDGQQALYAVFAGTGKPAAYTASNGKTKYDNISWTWDGSVRGVNTKEANGTQALYALPQSVRFAFKGLRGSHTLTAAFSTNHKAAASLDSLLLYVSNAGASVPAALQEGRFFEAGSRLCAEDLIFGGSGRIRLTAPDGTAIRNLRIYSVSGQTESVALSTPFKTAEDLSAWTQSGASVSVQPFKTEKEEPARVYAKGETINYRIFYSDWENDPSKKQHWVYVHEPLSDGAHPQAGKDLSAPVTKFYIDGKYTLTHWQEDSTGTASYDKESNRVSITFYIQSGPGNDAPWVRNIKTDPAAVRQGGSYTVKANVDDNDKDPLTVRIEVYKDAGSAPIASKTFRDVKPDASGKYPQQTLSGLPKAEPGTYDIVVTVSDGQGADVESMRFKVKEERSLTGSVTHTPAWEANRLAWNEAKKGTDAVRPANMFWPGEVLVLNAPCAGDPVSVDAQIVQSPQYAARLTRGAAGADGKPVYTGQLWNSNMLQTIGTARPVPATVRFTARYADSETLTWDVAIVFDQSNGSYYQLHRNY